MKTIGIIGFGNMGEALAEGLSRSVSDLSLIVSEPVEERAERARGRYNAETVDDVRELLERAEVTILAVKPQTVDSLCSEIKPHTAECRIISIVAGKSVHYLKQRLDASSIIRFMPNIAATEGKALVGIAYDADIDPSFLEEAVQIADAIGTHLVVPEHLMAVITGLSGSGIAFVFAFIHAMALGGTRAGLSYGDSVRVAGETVGGALSLLQASGENPVALLSRVISPAGTTIEGVAELEESGFTAAVMRAVVAASNRAADLER